MIPYPYNMVDMGGVDLAEANGTVVEGLYAKIVEAVNACGDVVLYNWKFAGIEIAPQHTSILLGDPITINGAVQVTEQDEVTVPGINPDPPQVVLVPLSVTENGLYNPDDYEADGFSDVSVNVEAPQTVLVPLSVTENGLYNPDDYEADGFSSVSVNVEASTISDDVVSYVFLAAPMYSDGYEYKGYVYGTSVIEECNLVLLADTSQQAVDSVQFAQPITNFSGLVLQGIYGSVRDSQYNTTLMYLDPEIGVRYWAGMKDRNSTYTCYVTLSSETEAVLSGTKKVIIYGIP